MPNQPATTQPRNATIPTQGSTTPVRSSPRLIPFILEARGAKAVHLAGTFNDWDPQANALKKDRQGRWRCTLELPPGRYEYKFVVDGEWRPDPKATENVPNEFGSENSVVVVFET
jgi:1,4-alpha-glucan branching enzyme